jgi:phytoene dehydrogenase-like protein
MSQLPDPPPAYPPDRATPAARRTPTGPPRVVIVGAGTNGLVAACLLARAGLAPIVLERRAIVGGVAVTEEIHPGFRCPGPAHAAGPFGAELAGELGLAAHGLAPIQPEVRVFAPSLTGPSVAIYQDGDRTAHALGAVSTKDAASYPAFAACFIKLGRMLRPVLDLTPPAVETPTLPEAWRLLKLGKSFRDLGKKDAYRLLRWGPMAVADLVAEWFETDLLRAVVAARGIHASFAGPWSAGTSVGLLLQAALDGYATLPSATFKGGPGALTQALARAAAAAGAEIRTNAAVLRILVADGKAAGVVLASGEEIPASAVVSAADPRTTFLGLVDPVDLEPDFLLKMRHYRATGTVAQIRYALSGLPAFAGAASDARLLSGRIHIGPGIDALERAFDAAKYGTISEEPYLDITLPSVADPTLAPAAAHVLSVHAQFAPYTLREGDWTSRAEELAARVETQLASYAPGFASLVVARRITTPADLESVYGLARGHLLHGEQALDQIFAMRPLLGWAQYRTPIRGLYLCGAGTHPGGGVSGRPGRNAAREILKDLKR